MLIERYNEVKKHVEEACKRVGRDPREVTVIAVSKTKVCKYQLAGKMASDRTSSDQ